MVIYVNPRVESLTAIVAGNIVSLLYRYAFNTPLCTIVQCCENVERDDEETDTPNGSTMAGRVVGNDRSHIPHTHISHISR